MMKRCPHCNQYYNVMERIGDFVHDCNSGNDTLDYDDMLHLSGPGWNLRGLNNATSPARRVLGDHNEANLTTRGNNSDTTRIVKHEEYIEN